MSVTRWCIMKPKPGELPQHALGASAASVRDELPDGWLLVEAEWDHAGFQSLPAFDGVVLPSLSAPASAAPPALQTLLAVHGVAAAATDDIQQLLRALRNARKKSFAVDKPF